MESLIGVTGNHEVLEALMDSYLQAKKSALVILYFHIFLSEVAVRVTVVERQDRQWEAEMTVRAHRGPSCGFLQPSGCTNCVPFPSLPAGNNYCK